MKALKKCISLIICLVLAFSAISANLSVGAATAQTITVSYDLNGGTGTVPEPSVLDYDGENESEVSLPEGDGFEKGELKFYGWSTDPKADKVQYFAGETGYFSRDTVLYAIWGFNHELINSHPLFYFNYDRENEELYINGYRSSTTLETDTLEIPSSVGGCDVVGIYDLKFAPYKVIIIPDSVRVLGSSPFDSRYVEKIQFGSGISEISPESLSSLYNLKSITVSDKNPNYTAVDGVLYDKAMTEIICYSKAKTGDSFTVPKSVTNIDNLNKEGLFIKFEEGSTIGVTQGGISYNSDKTVIKYVDKNITGKVTIPSSVKSIADNAFSNCNKMTEVTIPSGVTEIVYGAFSGCGSLQKVSMPSTVTVIGDYAFGDCEKLSSVNLPDNLKKIEESAFSSCKSLTGVKFPSKLTSIGGGAYKGTGISTVTLPNNVTYLGSAAFAETPLKTVVMSNGLTYFGSYCFDGCRSLISVKLPSKLTKIPSGAFSDTAKLTSITLPDTVTSIDSFAFCGSGLKTINLKNVTYIGDSAFRDCPITSLSLNERIKEIGNFAFSSTKIKSVTIPSGVTDIAYYMFAGSSDLAVVKAPDKLLKIKGCSFDYTKWFDSQKNGMTFIGRNLYKYKGNITASSKTKSIKVPDGTLSIAAYAFDNAREYDGRSSFNLSGLTSVTLPESVEYIGESAFQNCNELKSVNIGMKVKEIGYYSFCNCGKLTLKIEKSNTYAINYAKAKGIKYITYEFKLGNVNSLKASLSSYNDVKLSWSRVPSAEGYYVYYKKASSSKWSSAKTVNSTSYTFKDLSQNVKYSFKVVPFISDGSKVKSGGADYVSYSTTYNLSAPEKVSSKLCGYNDVALSWSKVKNADAYKIYYKKSTAKSYSYLTTTTSASYKKANLSDGVKYYFKVVPCTKINGSYYADTSYKTTNIYTLKKLSAPKVVRVNGSKVKVSWNNIEGESGYQISKSTSKSKTNIVSTYSTSSGKSKTINAAKGKTYYYKVRAYKTVDGKKIYGPWSNAVKFK